MQLTAVYMQVPEGYIAFVEELPGAELRARRGALRTIETSAGAHWHQVTLHLYNFKNSTSPSKPDDRENEVEHLLGRPLTPEERLLARRLLLTRRRPAEVADALQPAARHRLAGVRAAVDPDRRVAPSRIPAAVGGV